MRAPPGRRPAGRRRPDPSTATDATTTTATAAAEPAAPALRRRRSAGRPGARRSTAGASGGPSPKLPSSWSRSRARSGSSSVMSPLRNVRSIGCHAGARKKTSVAASPLTCLGCPLVDIREIDVADDDGDGRRCTASTSRSSHLGRESMPQWTLQEFLGAFRSERQRRAPGDPGRLRRRHAARLRRLLVPAARQPRQGLPRAARRPAGPPARCRARAARRGRGPGPCRRAARCCSPTPRSRRASARRTPTAGSPRRRGFEYSNVEVVRHLALPDRRRRSSRPGSTRPPSATRATRSRRTSTSSPTSSPSRCACSWASSPSTRRPGLVDFEEEDFNVDRLRERYADRRGDGPVPLRDGRPQPGPATVVAQSTLAVAKGDGARRLPVGHLRAPRAPRPPARPGREGRQHPRGAGRAPGQDAGSPRRTPRPTTSWSNINKEIGFEAVEDSMEWIKRL